MKYSVDVNVLYNYSYWAACFYIKQILYHIHTLECANTFYESIKLNLALINFH